MSAEAQIHIHLKDKKTKHNAVETLYRKYGRKLYAYSVSNWKLSEDESWDMVYKTLFKVIEAAPKYSFESEQALTSFVFKVFINFLRNHYRDHAKNKIEITEMNENLGISADEEALPNPRLNALNEELDLLEDWQRILLLMRSQDVPYAKIAEFVKKPESQLKVYYGRLKKLIADNLEKRFMKGGNENE